MDEDILEVAKIKNLKVGTSIVEIKTLGGATIKFVNVLCKVEKDGEKFEEPDTSALMFEFLDMDFLNNEVKYPCECYGEEVRGFDNKKSQPKISQDLGSMIMHLNDGHKWTRERIADWLDELHDSGVVNIIVEEKK